MRINEVAQRSGESGTPVYPDLGADDNSENPKSPKLVAKTAGDPEQRPDEMETLEVAADDQSAGFEDIGAENGFTRETPTKLFQSSEGQGLAIVIMGVTGSGKSTIGSLLAKSLNCNFIDADDFHSVENKEKMHNGFPLTDEDRIPWLEAVRDAMVDNIIKGKSVIVACSALQPRYREILHTADPEYALGFYDGVSSQKTKHVSFPSDEGRPCAKSLYSRKVVFVCLQASAELIASRLETRSKEGAHFMSPTLLQSQIDLLEIDDAEGVFFLDATLSPELITKNIQRKLLKSQLIS